MPLELPPPPLHDTRWALHLDFDGTLVELAPRPADVKVDETLRQGLTRLRVELGGALAIVTGRSLHDLDSHLLPLVLTAAGQHGLERRRGDGSVVREAIDHTALDRARAVVAALARADERLLIEDKGMTLALHYRQALDRSEDLVALATDLGESLAPALELLRGKEIIEFRPPHGHKGSAIAAFQAEPPFRDRVPVFLGDDVTDEDGFRAVARLGGIGIRVGPVPASLGVTAARFALADVAAVRDWLGIVEAAPT